MNRVHDWVLNSGFFLILFAMVIFPQFCIPQISSPLASEASSPWKAAAQMFKLKIIVLYDNNPFDPRLKMNWGFSCLIQGYKKTMLFDTGGDSAVLLNNMRQLGIDPAAVDVIVLSHIHGDMPAASTVSSKKTARLKSTCRPHFLKISKRP